MAGRRSAGILVFRTRRDTVEVLLGHMGGPYWAARHTAAWSIPKGEYDADEEPEAAARREFTEELGLPAPPGPLVPLGTVRQAGGKTVDIWAVEAEPDIDAFVPGTYEMEWPPKSGRTARFPELDRVEWIRLEDAHGAVVKGQVIFLDRLAELLKTRADGPGPNEMGRH